MEIVPLQILLKNVHTVTQRGSVAVTPPHLSPAVKGHKPPSDSCQSQEGGIIRSINNILKGSGAPGGWKSPDLSPLDMTYRKSAAPLTPATQRRTAKYINGVYDGVT